MITNKRNILLVEDNPGDVFLVREALGQLGIAFELVVFEDCERALAYLNQVDADETLSPPDLAMVDLNLPRGDGADLCRRIRNSPKFGHIPIIVLTGSESPRDHAFVAALNASVFRKPTADLDEFMRIGALVNEVLSSVRS